MRKEEYNKLHKKYIKLKEELTNLSYNDLGCSHGYFIQSMWIREELKKQISELEQKLNSYK